eukprot:14005940-Alexandrium_andersonii.AAC.1
MAHGHAQSAGAEMQGRRAFSLRQKTNSAGGKEARHLRHLRRPVWPTARTPFNVKAPWPE